MKYGIELEEFYVVNGVPAVVPPEYPHDDCGWLVEFRGEPSNDPYQAVGSALAEKEKIVQRMIADKAPGECCNLNYMNVPRAVKLAARRKYEKGLLRYQNLYGRQPSRLDHAGIHVSFTNEECVYDKDGKLARKVNAMWDFPTLFKALDKQFAEQIKAAARVPGFYELKSDGRIEYRSLPATLNLWEVAEFLRCQAF